MRALTRDRKREEAVVLGCSGGADSTALALALAGAKIPLVLAHVVHDVRCEAESLADRDRVRALAGMLGTEYSESRVEARVAGPCRESNLEARARRLRYAELVRTASERGARFVVTAHHADDQLETVLMALMRGAGVQGLGAIAPRRRAGVRGGQNGRDVWIVRPMLHATAAVTRAETEAMCREAGVEWAVDATNADARRLRSGLRVRVIPELRSIRPGVAESTVRATDVLRSSARAVDLMAARLLRGRLTEGSVPRDVLANQPRAVIGAAIRRAYRDVVGVGGIDAVSFRALQGVVRAVCDLHSETRTFDVGQMRVRVVGGVQQGGRLIGGSVFFERRGQ